MNIKMLKLCHWMVDYAEHDQGIPHKHEHFENLRKREYPYMVKSYPKIGVTDWPDGRYLQGMECFFVLNGIKYSDDFSMFKYDMEISNDYQDITRVDKILQLHRIELEIFGEASKNTARLYRAILRVKEHQQMYKPLAAMKKRIKERKLCN